MSFASPIPPLKPQTSALWLIVPAKSRQAIYACSVPGMRRNVSKVRCLNRLPTPDEAVNLSMRRCCKYACPRGHGLPVGLYAPLQKSTPTQTQSAASAGFNVHVWHLFCCRIASKISIEDAAASTGSYTIPRVLHADSSSWLVRVIELRPVDRIRF